MARKRHGRSAKLTKEERVKRELRNQRRGRTGGSAKGGARETWSLPKLVEEERMQRTQETLKKLGLVEDGE